MIRLLGSDRDGEALGAVYAIRRLLSANKRDLHDLAAIVERAPSLVPPPGELPPWRVMLAACDARSHKLPPKNRAFVRSPARWRGELTEKQMSWLADLFERVAGLPHKSCWRSTKSELRAQRQAATMRSARTVPPAARKHTAHQNAWA